MRAQCVFEILESAAYFALYERAARLPAGPVPAVGILKPLIVDLDALLYVERVALLEILVP